MRHSRERKQVSHRLARRQISNSLFLDATSMFSTLPLPPFLPRSVCHEEHQADCCQCQGEAGCRAGGKRNMGGAIYLLSSTCMSAPPPLSCTSPLSPSPPLSHAPPLSMHLPSLMHLPLSPSPPPLSCTSPDLCRPLYCLSYNTQTLSPTRSLFKTNRVREREGGEEGGEGGEVGGRQIAHRNIASFPGNKGSPKELWMEPTWLLMLVPVCRHAAHCDGLL